MTRPARFDAVIIGGGIAGCAAAVRLREAGLTVALVERDRCGGGASGVNFGGVRQQGRHPAELPLARRAREIWSTLSARLGEDTEFAATGHLRLARSDAEMADLEAYERVAREHGLELSLMGRNAVRAGYPWLGPAIVGASLAAMDGQANPRVVGPAFARLAARLGVEVMERTPATAAACVEDGFEIEAGGRPLRSRILINTAGMGAAGIAAQFGEHLPLVAIMPNMVVTEPLPYLAVQSTGVVGGMLYVRQIPRGNVIFGGGRGTGDWTVWRSRPSAPVTLATTTRMCDLVPAFRDAMIIRSWTGIDSETPDRLPIIGASTRTPGLLHATGFSGAGFQLAPAVGEVLAELALEGRTATPIAAFHPDRFAAGTSSALPLSHD